MNGNGDEDEDKGWDHIDSAKDLDEDAAAKTLGLKDANTSVTATIHGHRTKQQRHQYQPKVMKDTATDGVVLQGVEETGTTVM